jgi:hypothetical protein
MKQVKFPRLGNNFARPMALDSRGAGSSFMKMRIIRDN